MYKLDDPDEMTPDERFKEIARYLAMGFIRSLRQVTPCVSTDPDDSAWRSNRTSIITSEKLVTDDLSTS